MPITGPIDRLVRNHLHRTATIVQSLRLDAESIQAIIDAMAALFGGDADIVNTPGSASAVAFSAETTVVSYTVPVDKVFFFDGAVAEGDSDGKFRLKIDAVTQSTKRNNWTSRNIDFWGTLKLTAGQVIIVTAENIASGGGASDYTSNIFGRLVDVSA